MKGVVNYPNQRYSVLYVDFPWWFNQRVESRGNSKYGWGSSASYERRGGSGGMKAAEIVDVVHRANRILTDNALVFMWTTPSNMQEALPVFAAWRQCGFSFGTRFLTWVKLNESVENIATHLQGVEPTWESVLAALQKVTFFGVGAWAASNTEDLWVLKRGGGWLAKRQSFQPQVLYAPVNKQTHSRKPAEALERIDLGWAAGLPRLELFATESGIEGWDALGDEIDGCDIRQDLNEMIGQLAISEALAKLA